MTRRRNIVANGVISGNVYDKYRSANPIARRLLKGFMSALFDLVDKTGVSDIHEVGCGEGELSIALARRGKRVRGSDFSEEIIREAKRRAVLAGLTDEQVSFEVRDLYQLEAGRDSAPLIVCCEVLEHLEVPELALTILAELADPYVLVSVPREPLWRLLNLTRGKYLRSLGNTPGHVQWWSKSAFLSLLRRHFALVEVRSPLPWTMALCRSGVGR